MVHASACRVGVARTEWATRFATSSEGPGPDADTHEDWVPRQVLGFRHAVAMFERLDPRDVVHAPPHARLMPMA